LIYGFIGEGHLGEVLRIREQVLARRRLGQPSLANAFSIQILHA
jgi:hypothetical protein